MDVGSKVAYLIDELVGDVCFVLKIKVFKSCIHHFEKVMLVYNCVGKFLNDKGSTLR